MSLWEDRELLLCDDVPWLKCDRMTVYFLLTSHIPSTLWQSWKNYENVCGNKCPFVLGRTQAHGHAALGLECM